MSYKTHAYANNKLLSHLDSLKWGGYFEYLGATLLKFLNCYYNIYKNVILKIITVGNLPKSCKHKKNFQFFNRRNVSLIGILQHWFRKGVISLMVWFRCVHARLMYNRCQYRIPIWGIFISKSSIHYSVTVAFLKYFTVTWR